MVFMDKRMNIAAIGARRSGGFTIVELLIVIVVIAILAAITIVAYNGIQQRARTTAAQSTLTQLARSLEAAKVTAGQNSYPNTLASASITSPAGYSHHYSTRDSGRGYCLTITAQGRSFFITSANQTASPGSCDGLVGWWNMNQTSNARDLSGTGADGVVTGALSVSGYNNTSNGAYEFTPTGSHIRVTSTQLLNVHNSGQVSYSVWFYGTGASGYLVTRGTGSGGGTVGMQSCQYEPSITSSSTSLSGCGGSGGVNGYSPTTGQWNHLVVSFDAAANATIFLNGVEQSSKAVSTIRAASGSALIFNAQAMADFLVIGGQFNSGGNSFLDGDQIIDDVRVYNRPLTLPDVQLLYESGAQ
jgi:prepilin-type N-terminal cleavage/methylation domain-containing protein